MASDSCVRELTQIYYMIFAGPMQYLILFTYTHSSQMHVVSYFYRLRTMISHSASPANSAPVYPVLKYSQIGMNWVIM